MPDLPRGTSGQCQEDDTVRILRTRPGGRRAMKRGGAPGDGAKAAVASGGQ